MTELYFLIRVLQGTILRTSQPIICLLTIRKISGNGICVETYMRFTNNFDFSTCVLRQCLLLHAFYDNDPSFEFLLLFLRVTIRIILE
jgi:hypothetical protein